MERDGTDLERSVGSDCGGGGTRGTEAVKRGPDGGGRGDAGGGAGEVELGALRRNMCARVRYVAGKDTEGLTEEEFGALARCVAHEMSMMKSGKKCHVVWAAWGAGRCLESSCGEKRWKEYEFWAEAGRSFGVADSKLDLKVQGWETKVEERGAREVTTRLAFWRRAVEQRFISAADAEAAK
jgi:hypothetical protein